MCTNKTHVLLYAALVLLAFAPFPAAAADAEERAATPYEQAIREAERELATEADVGGNGAITSPASWGMKEWLGLVALLAAVGLMVAMARRVRGLGFGLRPGGAAGREMRVIDRLVLGRRESLIIVRLRGRDYWLSQSEESIRLLAELPPQTPPEAPHAPQVEPPH